ncbi:hypothetical protein RhiirA4_468447 [Rhizophagus irregularis]|uniref:Uncharacterized protein n=1 Tax=Rhizophagus irregularis TaxID=588596 RepID=A0A2I1GXR5_9GLOM|nr:hypothetical protein RhiirA4_468447 [Rhizophagus irregularis]
MFIVFDKDLEVLYVNIFYRIERLTEETSLIEEMKLKHEAEINLLKQLNIELEFVKAR